MFAQQFEHKMEKVLNIAFDILVLVKLVIVHSLCVKHLVSKTQSDCMLNIFYCNVS